MLGYLSRPFGPRERIEEGSEPSYGSRGAYIALLWAKKPTFGTLDVLSPPGQQEFSKGVSKAGLSQPGSQGLEEETRAPVGALGGWAPWHAPGVSGYGTWQLRTGWGGSQRSPGGVLDKDTLSLAPTVASV